jgi:predicted nucleic acid-binding protein
VSSVYIDTSALGRVLLDTPEASTIQRDIDRFDRCVASRLLRIEIQRVALREALLDAVDPLLTDISLIPLDEEILTAAETIHPATVATLDAIHLATAMRLAEAGELDALMTYDMQLATGAREHGITVLSPS